MIFIGAAQQAGRLVLDRGADDGRIGQTQRHLMPALGQRSILIWAVTCTTSLATTASFSISVMTAPTGGRNSAAGRVLSWAAFQSSSNFS